MDLENTIIDLEKQFDQISFLKFLELEEPMNIPHIIETPVNEQKNPKRNMEEASRSVMVTTN